MKHDNSEVLRKLNRRCSEPPPLTDREKRHEQILRLRLEEQLPYSEIAQRLQIKMGNATVRFSVARRWIEQL